MGSSDAPQPQRPRTKAPDFSELFRSSHGSRHTSRTGAGTGSSPSSTPLPGEKPSAARTPSRRSMLPFLGRKKPAEQTAVPPTPMSRKSVGHASYPVTPVNTVRRSFGNGHAVFMITPSNVPQAEPPLPPPLPSKIPPVDVHSSLGSKLAAHFTPLRSPSRTPTLKARSPTLQKIPEPVPPLPSAIALSPQFVEPEPLNMRSRSTTPRPTRMPPPLPLENGSEEDFSDLFTLPAHLKKPQQPLQSPSSTSLVVYPEDSSKKSGDLTPTTPLGPPLQFPIPPTSFGPPRTIVTEKGLARYSAELASLSSHRSSPSKASAVMVDGESSRTPYNDVSSHNELTSNRHRSASVSGSDTDTSRANDSAYSMSSFKLGPVRPSSKKGKLLVSSAVKASSSGPPPSAPLPSPPLSPKPGGGSATPAPRSAPNDSPNRVAFPRPRANTLSVTSNLAIPTQGFPKSSHSSPTRSNRVNSDVAPEVTVDELRENLSQQRRKNAQLQEYIGTITKRYEDDRTAMTRTIEKLERNIRKKLREIEGLRWLVIHNGGVSDIDAAANLARASFSTLEDEAPDDAAQSSQPPPSPMVPPYHNGVLTYRSASEQQGASITATAPTTTPEGRSDSATSFSASTAQDATTPMTPSLVVIPERIDTITRAERQRLKQERRASKALRRISATSTFVVGSDALARSSSVEHPVDPNFDPKQGMDQVLERLQPFRRT